MALLTRKESAARCRVSLAAFEQHVRPALTPVRIGRRVLFRSEDIDAWEGNDKVSRSAVRRPIRSGTSVSPLLAELLSDPQVQATAKQLKQRVHASTQTRSAESPSDQPSAGAVVLRLPSRTL